MKRGSEGASDEPFPGTGPAPDLEDWERSVSEVVAAADDELDRRAHADMSTVTTQVRRWAGPLFRAAAVIALLAGAGLLLEDGRGANQLDPRSEVGLEEVVLSPTIAAWWSGARTPTVEEIVLSSSAGSSTGPRRQRE